MLWIRRVLVPVLCLIAITSACTRNATDGATRTPPTAQTPDVESDTARTGETTAVPQPGTGDSSDQDFDSAALGWPLDIDAEPEPDNPAPLEGSPEVRTGVLDNGLRYYVRSHAEPAQALSLRLVVNAGSLQQEAPESGLAHFVEHMLFNGTQAYPGNELDAVLQRLGAELGPDLNAYTSADETVYKLDLQDDDEALYDVAFNVVREWSSRALFDPDEVAAERGVVREETRSYYTAASAELDTTFDDSYDAGTAYLGRFPGGRGEAVMAITADEAREFYQRWYRPDNMAVVAVGDYPADDLEATIVERFSDLGTPEIPLDTVPDPGPDWNAEPIVKTITSPSYARNAVSIDWPVPANPLATVGDVERRLRDELVVAVLDDRLTRLGDAPDPIIFDAYATSFDWNRHRSIIGLNAGSGDLLAATTLILSEFGSVAERGVTQSEFDRAVDSLRRVLEQSQDKRAGNAELADSYASSFLVGSSTIDDDAFATVTLSLLDAMTPQGITNHWRYLASRTAPIVVLISEDEAHAVSEDAAAAAVAAASPDQATTTSDIVAIDELVEAPPSVAPIENYLIDSVDRPTRVWSYANGATVVFVQSEIEPKTFLVTGQQPGGTSRLAEPAAARTALAIAAVENSSLGDVSRASVERFTQEAQVAVATVASAYSGGFGASGAAAGFDDALQVLYARTVRGGIDAPGYEAASRMLSEALRFGSLDPTTRTAQELARVRFGDERSWHTPVEGDLDAGWTEEDLFSTYQQLFGGVDDTTTIVIVGDLAVDDVRATTDIYVANLPNQPAEPPLDRQGPPIDDVRASTITFGEPGTSGELVEYFSAALDIGDAELVTAAVTADILDQRLFDAVREELSATYGGVVDVSPAAGPTMGFETTISFAGDPGRVQEMRDRIVDEIADLATNGPSDDELQRARAVLDTDWAYLSNGDLFEQAIRAVRGDEALRWGDVGIASVPSERKRALLSEVSADSVRVMATSLWSLDRRVEVLRVPEDSE